MLLSVGAAVVFFGISTSGVMAAETTITVGRAKPARSESVWNSFPNGGLTSEYGGNPLWEMDHMMERMQRLIHQNLLEGGESGGGSFGEPRLDVQELSDKYLIQADLPGMEKDKLNLSVTDDALTISGERKMEVEKNQNGMRLMERSFGHFERSLPMPENVKTDQISAKYDQGVLTVVLPKANPAPLLKKEGVKIPIR